MANIKEFDMQPTEGYDVDCRCPVCDQEFVDKCPPDMDMDDRIKCPQCGKWLITECVTTIEREYTMEIDDDQQND